MGPDREQRACTWQQAGIREEVMGEEAECWTNTLNSGHAFNGLTQMGVGDKLKRAKTQVK